MHTEEKGTQKQKQASNVVADFLEQKTVAILRIYPNFFHQLAEKMYLSWITDIEKKVLNWASQNSKKNDICLG